MKQVITQKTPSKLFCTVYVMLMAGSTLYKYFLSASFPWWITQLCYIAVIVLSCSWILVTGELSRVAVSMKVMLVMLSPYLLLILYSIALWLFRLDQIYYIRRGLIDTSYLVLAILTVGCSVMVFGEKHWFLTFIGFAIGNAMIALSIVKSYGLSTVVSDMFSFFASFFKTETTVTKAFEVHSLTFALAGMMVGIILMRLKTSRKVWSALICMVFLLVGWKRSALIAIVFGLLLYYMTGSYGKKTVVWKMHFFGIIMIVIAYAYVCFIRLGVYDLLIEKFDINVMGRNVLYETIKNYYDVSLGYSGRGAGFPSSLLIKYMENGDQILNGERTIHSDILAKYIEMGFPVYLIWSYLNYSLIGVHLSKHYSERAGRIWMACIGFCYVTYFTDNTAGYMPVVAMTCSITMSSLFENNSPLLPSDKKTNISIVT